VLSYFTKRADAATGVRRKSFKYLDDAKIEVIFFCSLFTYTVLS
jgi:hypothetical protein